MFGLIIARLTDTLHATRQPRCRRKRWAPPPSTSITPNAPDAQPVDWGQFLPAILITLAVLAAAAIVAAIGFVLWRSAAKQREQRRKATFQGQTQLQRWETGVTALNAASAAVWEFESDIKSVYFTWTLLSDVTEPASEAFYTAYAEAIALHAETPPADDDLVTAFVAGAKKAERAFSTANDNALRKARLGIIHGNRQLTRAERRKLDQAEKLLNQALDTANTPELAKTAHAKAQALLDEVGVVIPERLTANAVRAIESVNRPALMAPQP